MKTKSNEWIKYSLLAGACTMILGSCTSDESLTDLNPDGPPMIRQVFVDNQFENTIQGQAVFTPDRDIIFGSHPDFEESTLGTNTKKASAGENEIRIVVDELLLGNSLEEVECADGIFASEYAKKDSNGDFIEFPIPTGTTPDDLARCSGPPASLISNPPDAKRDCTKVCVGPNGEIGPSGAPIGILDENGSRGVGQGGPDGAADSFRLFEYGRDAFDIPLLGAEITCGDRNIEIDRLRSFWNPTGNQLLPQAGPLLHKALGPVIVLFPRFGLRTSSTCTISINPSVTDKDGNSVCIPPEGDVTKDCDPSIEISFDTEALEFKSSSSFPMDGGTLPLESPITEDTKVLLVFNASLDAASLETITLATAGGADVPFTINWSEADPNNAELNFVEGDLLPLTDYVLTIPTTVTDTYGGALQTPSTHTFSTN